MKKSIKIIVLSVAVLLCALAFTACGLFEETGDGGGGGGETPKSVTVTLSPNGGTAEKLTVIGLEGSEMILPTPIRDGYTFDAWYNGWNIISNSVFPTSDITLTARYYATNDSEQEANANPTEFNKVFKANTGDITWGKEQFGAHDWSKIEYLKKNVAAEIDVVLSMEAMTSQGSYHYDSHFSLRGANFADVLASYSNYNAATFKEFILTASAVSGIMVGSGDTVLRLRYGSVSSIDSMTQTSLRNINLSIKYTEKAGTLV